MAKYFIFDNTSKNLTRLADTDEKKDNFLHLQNIYTAIQVNDNDYNDVKNGLKKTTLSNDNTAITENFQSVDVESLNTEDLDEAKKIIKGFIKKEIREWQSFCPTVNSQQIRNALKSVNVDSLTSVPTGTVFQWILSQPGVNSKRPFEL
jgi:hypothetical protein